MPRKGPILLRACFKGGGRPLVNEVTRLVGLPACPYNLLFYLDHVYMISGVTQPGGLPGLLGRITLTARVMICNVNVSRWGNRQAGVTLRLHLQVRQ